MIENGTLNSVADMFDKYFPVHQVTIHVLFEFVRMISIHDKGKEFIKKRNLFEKILMPCVVPGNEY
jgi:hypothetical protein